MNVSLEVRNGRRDQATKDMERSVSHWRRVSMSDSHWRRRVSMSNSHWRGVSMSDSQWRRVSMSDSHWRGVSMSNSHWRRVSILSWSRLLSSISLQPCIGDFLLSLCVYMNVYRFACICVHVEAPGQPWMLFPRHCPCSLRQNLLLYSLELTK